jgi:hypothetical protein
MSNNNNKNNPEALDAMEEYRVDKGIDESEEESEPDESNVTQLELEKSYGIPLTLLEPRGDLAILVSTITGRDGYVGLKRLILEERLPVIVDSDGTLYEEWMPDGLSLVWDLLAFALEDWKKWKEEGDSPEYALREYLGTAVIHERGRLETLELQLAKEGEFSAVLRRKIEALRALNTDIPFQQEELDEILN